MKKVDADMFNEVLRDDDRIKVLTFYAEWCNPCSRYHPIVESVEADFEEADFHKMDIDSDNRTLAKEYGVKMIPTVVLFRNGKEVSRNAGSMTKEELRRLVQDAHVLSSGHVLESDG